MHDFRRKQSLLLQQIFRILKELPLDKAQFHFRCEQSTNSDVTIFPVAVFSTHFRPFLINESQFVLSITKSESALLCVSMVSNKDKQVGSKIEFHNFC